MAKITVIPSTKQRDANVPALQKKKRRVAAYARVSTDYEEQATSYEAQISYYTDLIQKNNEWEFVKVYTDEGISGTNTKHRLGFQEMIKDAMDGKIDLIITKSVSRFARNTVDSLTNIRKLKEKNVEVYFQKENIYTFDSKGELLLTIMSSLAQEESRSISENVTWGKRYAFKCGKVHFAYKSFLGYEKGEDGKPKINEEQAEIVRTMYRMFLDGQTAHGIATYLNENNIPTPLSKGKWSQDGVTRILTNEKYKGDALLQKKFVVDFLQHKSKKNEGEIPQYYVEDSHEGIIDKFIWDMVQLEIERRKKFTYKYMGSNTFSNKLLCGDCGGVYGLKVWHSNQPNRKEVFQCNQKFKNEIKCKTPHLTEEEVKRAFVKVYNDLNKDLLIEETKYILENIIKVKNLDSEIEKQREDVELIVEMVRKLVNDNSSTALDQAAYEKKYKMLEDKFEEENLKLQELIKEKEYNDGRVKRLQTFIDTFESLEPEIEDFDISLFNLMIERAVVYQDKTICFHLYNGNKITIDLSIFK